MSTLAVIPARLGATRLPRKPLRLLGGVPLILRVLDRVAALAVADRVVVATDSEEVAALVGGAGGEALLTDAGHQSGTDRVADVTNRPAFRGYDVIVNIQGDEPFVTREAVQGAVDQLRESGFPLGTVAVRGGEEILLRPDVVKVVRAEDGAALYFSRAPIPFLRDPADRAQRDALVLQHVGVYAYTPAALRRWVRRPPHPLERVERLEQLRPLAAGERMGVAVIDGPVSSGIDTEADLSRANATWLTPTAAP